MLGAAGEYSSSFLTYFPMLILVVFALPMILKPLTWGRVIGFSLPEDSDLAVYFGRSLGVAAIGICVMCFSAAGNPPAQPMVFDGLIAISALYVATHIHGAIYKIQPLIETLEIGFWFGLMLLQIAVYPVHIGTGLLAA